MRDLQGYSMIEQGDLVRALLVRARILKQEAVVQAEFDEYYQEIGGGFERTTRLLIQAQQLRWTAQICLKQMEVANGQAYVKGNRTVPLSFLVCGRDFKEWACYKNLYNNSDVFQGVDPSG